MSHTGLSRRSSAPRDPMRVYVLWASSGADGDDAGHRVAHALSEQLDALGMVRDGVGFRIPVRQRSQPWRKGGTPRPIDLDAAQVNVVVVVADDVMNARLLLWNDYLEPLARQLEHRGDLILPVIISEGHAPPALAQREIQGVVAPVPVGGDHDWAHWLCRVTLYLMGCMWVHQRKMEGRPTALGDPRKVGVFISHAKRDGNAAAQLVRRFTDVARPGSDTGMEVPSVNSIELYFDAYDTVAASSFSKQFEDAIASGALLAIVTDNYHGRIWCTWEFLKAKQHRCPIVVWDVSHRGTLRSGPYLGNVPVVRMPHVRYCETGEGELEEIDLKTVSDADIEMILLAIISEALRMAVWTRHAEDVVAQSSIAATVVCARPPELADLAHAARDNAIVYPDPPINQHEIELIRKAFPHLQLLPLSEVHR